MNNYIIIIKDNIEYKQKANSHLKGFNVEINKHKVMYDILKKCHKIFNNEYVYDENMKYQNINQIIKIKCKIHGFFNKSINKHLNNKQGCPSCISNISKGEKRILEFLNTNNINYLTQYTFLELKDIRNLKFDFYLPKYNLAIKFNGLY